MELPPAPAPVIAAAYLRSAKGDPDQIAVQLAVCRRYADEHGYVLSDEHVFRSARERGLFEGEPGWTWLTQILSRTDDLRPTVLLVTAPSRVGRADPGSFDAVLGHVQKHGVRLEWTDPDYAIHPADPGDALARRILDFVERQKRVYARKVIGRMSVRGRERARNARAGRFFSSPAPYGFVRVPELESPEGWEHAVRTGNWLLRRATTGEFEAVQHLFARLREGVTLRALAQEMNARAEPLPRAARRWSPPRISSIVRNPIYMGDLVSPRRGEPPVVTRGWVKDPPVTREVFEEVQRRLRSCRRLRCG